MNNAPYADSTQCQPRPSRLICSSSSPAQDADAICVQEIKAQDRDLSDAIRNPGGYLGYFHCADQRGYSGVGIYCRKKPDRVIEGLGIPDIDAEGRYLEAQFGNLSIVSVYVLRCPNR